VRALISCAGPIFAPRSKPAEIMQGNPSSRIAALVPPPPPRPASTETPKLDAQAEADSTAMEHVNTPKALPGFGGRKASTVTFAIDRSRFRTEDTESERDRTIVPETAGKERWSFGSPPAAFPISAVPALTRSLSAAHPRAAGDSDSTPRRPATTHADESGSVCSSEHRPALWSSAAPAQAMARLNETASYKKTTSVPSGEHKADEEDTQPAAPAALLADSAATLLPTTSPAEPSSPPAHVAVGSPEPSPGDGAVLNPSASNGIISQNNRPTSNGVHSPLGPSSSASPASPNGASAVRNVVRSPAGRGSSLSAPVSPSLHDGGCTPPACPSSSASTASEASASPSNRHAEIMKEIWRRGEMEGVAIRKEVKGSLRRRRNAGGLLSASEAEPTAPRPSPRILSSPQQAHWCGSPPSCQQCPASPPSMKPLPLSMKLSPHSPSMRGTGR